LAKVSNSFIPRILYETAVVAQHKADSACRQPLRRLKVVLQAPSIPQKDLTLMYSSGIITCEYNERPAIAPLPTANPCISRTSEKCAHNSFAVRTYKKIRGWGYLVN
jgi:hypothetical protein